MSINPPFDLFNTRDNVKISVDDTLITLSTCAAPGMDEYRYLVVGKLIAVKTK